MDSADSNNLQTDKNENYLCCLCKKDTDNVIIMGQMKTGKKFKAHYYCLLFSSNLTTKEDDYEGSTIEHFSEDEIEKEIKRTKRLKCYVCKQFNASIGCVNKMCKRSFHRECGFNQQCQFMFKEPSFLSFCDKHVQLGQIDGPSADQSCSICQELLGPFSVISPIRCNQCNSLFHNLCLMKQAIRSANQFKCPVCNEYENFRENCKERGVFIPESEPTWESEQFYEENPIQTCIASQCKFQTAHSSNLIDVFLFCDTCGAAPLHLACNDEKEEYTCANCKTELQLESHDLVQAKLNSALEKINCLEMNLKAEMNDKNEIMKNIKILEDHNGELKLTNENNLKQMKEMQVENIKILKKMQDIQVEKDTIEEKLQLAITGIFCPCKKQSDDDYVQCSNSKCPISWYHYKCAGISKKPTKEWFCKDCGKIGKQTDEVN